MFCLVNFEKKCVSLCQYVIIISKSKMFEWNVLCKWGILKNRINMISLVDVGRWLSHKKGKIFFLWIWRCIRFSFIFYKFEGILVIIIFKWFYHMCVGGGGSVFFFKYQLRLMICCVHVIYIFHYVVTVSLLMMDTPMVCGGGGNQGIKYEPLPL